MKNRVFSKEAWTFLVLSILTVGFLLHYVDLTPQVDNDAFFSSDDPTYESDQKITELFRNRSDSQIIISVKGDIQSKDYQDKIRSFTNLLLQFKDVVSAKSVTHGPINIQDAIESPLWNRMLISDRGRSSNIIAIIAGKSFEDVVPRIEGLSQVLNAKNFEIRISGFPYVVELIRRNLLIDLNIFSALAFVLFSIFVIVIFHSRRILLGMILTCANACAITLLITHYTGIRIGILTANLATIILVLTLSHIVFLTFNWRSVNYINTQLDQVSSVDRAMAMTCPASFWSAVTTVLGFGSLLFTQAKPLRELGFCGTIGTTVAFCAAYGIYPAFLRLKKIKFNDSDVKIKHIYDALYNFFERGHGFVVLLIMTLFVLTLPYLWRLNTDPDLISYFNPKSDITKGLKYIDKNGGSSPLVMVVQDNDGQTLNTNKTFNKMWELHLDLEEHPDVGTVISLPTLLAEGKRNIFGRFFASEWILNILDSPKYDRIAKSFVTPDRKHGLFILRMVEEGRKKHRLEVIDEIAKVVRHHGFNAQFFGGIYALQGHLSKHIASSLVFGLSRLIFVFFIISWIISRSLRSALAMTLSIGLVASCILGGIGYLHIPVDTISAPATNVAIAIGIDAMIHMIHAHRRLVQRGEHHIDDWLKVRQQMWEPIITSMFIICAGFGIFFFSSFPPTQRFGGAIVFGTFIASMTALFIFPLLVKKEGQLK